MGQLTYVLALESLPEAVPRWTPTDAEVEAYYAAHMPGQAAPLESVRPFVVDALVRSRAAAEASLDPLEDEARATDIDVFATLAGDFETLASHASLAAPRRFVSYRNQHWFAASDGVDAMSQLAASLASAPSFRPDNVRDAARAAIERCKDVLTRARAAGRRFRFEEVDHRISFDRQIEVLASAGITAREGTPRESLLYNWPEEDWEKRPWGCLFDLIDHSDVIAEPSCKSVETEDDADRYGSLARLVMRLARGALPLENVESLADFDAETAYLAFDLDGVRHRIDFEWLDGWVDMRLYTQLDRLLRARTSHAGLYEIRSHDPPGEGIVLVVLDDDAYGRLRIAGVPVSPMR